MGIHSEMKLLSGILALAQADPSTFFTTCGPVLSYSSSSIHTELAGDWKVAVDGSQQALTNDNYPYYQHSDGETFMWWMWHGDVGHWVVNKTPGTHGGDIIKSTFADFACPQDIAQWNEFTNGADGSFEITSCMCDSIDWDGDSVAAGTWTKTDQVNDLWPVYQNGDLSMWWMWHGAVGHWVINASPGTHGNDQAKTVGFADMACPASFTDWSIGTNGQDFNIQCGSRYNADYCAANAPVYELRANRSSFQRYGKGAWGMRVNTNGIPETTQYTGLLAWGKSDCGQDFLEKVNSGEVGVYVVDQEIGYEMQYRYLAEKNSKHTSVVVQFKAEACADPTARCLGNTRRDQYELYITGTDKVNFGNKDEQECLGTLRNGFIGEKETPTVTDEDHTPCIAWTNNYWN